MSTGSRRAESGETLTPTEAVSRRQALELYTLNAAYASSREKSQGSIAPGKLADLVLLSRNPLKAEAEELKEIRVEMTITGGKVVWER
jgi:predicted amidohydrolase YtcJ